MLFIGTQFSSLYTAVDPSLILADVVNMDYDDDDDIHAPGPMIHHLACGKAVSANRAKHRGVYIYDDVYAQAVVSCSLLFLCFMKVRGVSPIK